MKRKKGNFCRARGKYTTLYPAQRRAEAAIQGGTMMFIRFGIDNYSRLFNRLELKKFLRKIRMYREKQEPVFRDRLTFTKRRSENEEVA
ncbi:MAG: hypothetical protein ACL93V_03765 [Candidatus Electrothrix sp. YB6]